MSVFEAKDRAGFCWCLMLLLRDIVVGGKIPTETVCRASFVDSDRWKQNSTGLDLWSEFKRETSVVGSRILPKNQKLTTHPHHYEQLFRINGEDQSAARYIADTCTAEEKPNLYINIYCKDFVITVPSLFSAVLSVFISFFSELNLVRIWNANAAHSSASIRYTEAVLMVIYFCSLKI